MRNNHPKKLIIHAPNVHMGGGNVLLIALLTTLNKLNFESLFICDARFSYPNDLSQHIKIFHYQPSFLGRFLAECCLKKNAQKNDIVLCFGSLPPLFKLNTSTFLFLQNCHLFKSAPMRAFGIKTKLRIQLEKIYLRIFLRNIDFICVQTPSMQASVKRNFSFANNILILPFIHYGEDETIAETNIYDFIYVASGEAHKNHHNLLLAWKILAEHGHYPTLCLTLDKKRDKQAYEFMEKIKTTPKINIKNFGILSHQFIQQLYRSCRALIFPSLCESFGLPLIEARRAGLEILAPELDYVRDIIEPEQTFDPNSPTSISRAVLRYLNMAEQPITPIDTSEFINTLISLGEVK